MDWSNSKRTKRAETRIKELIIPFFVWMENHEVCIGKKGGTYIGFNETHGLKTSQVVYSSYGTLEKGKPINVVDGIHFLVHSPEGLIMEFPVGGNNSGKLRVFDTQHLRGKTGETGSAAFVWTSCGTLLAGSHQGGHLHHSSFVGGASIRCSGMIKVVHGKVHMISDNSGHYRPSEENLRGFGKWLNKINVFSPTCRAKCLGMGYDVPIEEFLGEGPIKFAEVYGPNYQLIGKHLDALEKCIKEVAIEYHKADRSFFRIKSAESKNALDYFENAFSHDIRVAKKDMDDPSWVNLPVEVIRFLLGLVDLKTFNELKNELRGRPVIGNQNFSKLSSITPLKKSSTMYKILALEYRKWNNSL